MKQKNECSFEKKLNAYIAGELSEIEHTKVREHISSCHLCQNEIRTLHQVDNFLNLYTEKEVPAELNEKILNSVFKNRTNPFMRKVISFSIAASVLISFMAGIMLSSGLYAESSDSDITIGEDS
ncbi:MAG: zf-HC2 domain-containing protein, partial [FCB group bacterium]|nr:zf-HC2 domain-containing protein [FCB group bacterium]